MSVVHFSSPLAVTIGFDAATYTFTETDSTDSRPVSVSVQSGSLARDVVVTVQTVDGSATGGFSYTHTHTHFVDVSFTFSLPHPLATDYTTVSIQVYHFSLQLLMTTRLCPWT